MSRTGRLTRRSSGLMSIDSGRITVVFVPGIFAPANLVGQDLLRALDGVEADEALISESMLRENTDSFLDDMTLKEVENRLNRPLRVIRNHGESLIRGLWRMEETDV